MTNQNNLPAWARILLGIPAGAALQTRHDEKDREDSSSRSALSSASIAEQQAIMVFDGGGCVRHWKRKTSSSSSLGEAAW
jgi:hypothetical protein